jgi:hypothetical protein
MLYLLWFLLNVLLVISLFVICFKATKLIREKLGLVASLVFVVGLLSFVGYKNNKQHTSKENYWQLNKISTQDLLFTKAAFATLDKNMVFQTSLSVAYGQPKDTNMIVPVEAYSILTGFVGGHEWKPHLVDVEKIGSNLRYTIQGTVEWKLLAFNIFSENKKYTGLLDIE